MFNNCETPDTDFYVSEPNSPTDFCVSEPNSPLSTTTEYSLSSMTTQDTETISNPPVPSPTTSELGSLSPTSPLTPLSDDNNQDSRVEYVPYSAYAGQLFSKTNEDLESENAILKNRLMNSQLALHYLMIALKAQESTIWSLEDDLADQLSQLHTARKLLASGFFFQEPQRTYGLSYRSPHFLSPTSHNSSPMSTSSTQRELNPQNLTINKLTC